MTYSYFISFFILILLSIGLCSERVPLPNNSKYQRAEKLEKMIRCFELAGDLTLLYLQEQDKLTSTPSTHSLQSLPAATTTGRYAQVQYELIFIDFSVIF